MIMRLGVIFLVVFEMMSPRDGLIVHAARSSMCIKLIPTHTRNLRFSLLARPIFSSVKKDWYQMTAYQSSPINNKS